MTATAPMPEPLVDRDRANRMFDAYGSLLTTQQQRLLRRYYQDDLSLGEIAEQMRVSRQAVHDGVHRALAAMERYEKALRLVASASPRHANGTGPAEHYFASTPRSKARRRRISVTVRGRAWTFETASGVFSHRGLDAGTRLLIETIRVGRADRILDLGCGYGAVGLIAASRAPKGEAWLIDANQRAVALAASNARANHLTKVHVLAGDVASAIRDATVDLVVTNPPIRAGRRVVQDFINQAWRVLRPGGRFYLVARTAQGARTLGRLISERFGEVRQVATSGGYRVFEAARQRPGGLPRRAGTSGPEVVRDV